MEQSISPPLDCVNNASDTTSSSTVINQDINKTQLELQELQFTSEISDDEVQIMCVKKQEKHVSPPIEVKSDEDAEKDPTSEQKKTVEEVCDSAHPQAQRTTRCNSPKDVTCSICLGEFDNKSYLDQCFHAFCFYCILQWSEIVRTCPLCKATFSSIIHSVKSMMEYEVHKLHRQERSSKQQIGIDIGRRIILVDDTHLSRQHQLISSSSSLWDRRARRRERRLSLQRRKQIEAKNKRKSIYANNLWVQNVTQRGRAKFRDTSPQFFRNNPACSHRLVPWLTRELNCLLGEDQSHVDFLLELVMTLITRVEISSEEFIQQLQPFLFDKAHHFVHEFLSFARSPYDMNAHDERAQYDWPRATLNQGTETPFISNTSNTGWDTPDEFGTSGTLSPSTSSPGPSGLSGSLNWNEAANYHERRNNWSPPFAPEHQRPLTDESTSTNSLSHEEVTAENRITVSSQKELTFDLHKLSQRKHGYKGKGKRQSRKSGSAIVTVVSPSNPVSNYITVSSCGSTESQCDVILVSSEETSSPIIRQAPKANNTGKSTNNLKRRSSSEECSLVSRAELLQESHKSPRSKRRSGKHSLRSRGRYRKSPSSLRPRKRSTRSRSPADNHPECNSNSRTDIECFLSETAKSENERPSSPTEEEMKREISALEKKIAEDTKRLTQLLIKQEKRRVNNVKSKVPNATNIADDELSR